VFTDEGMHASPMDDWSKEVERMRSTRNWGDDPQVHGGTFREVPCSLRPERRGRLSNEETARILGLSVPAIKSRLHRPVFTCASSFPAISARGGGVTR